MKVKTKCQECGYEWETESKLRFVSCPNCLRKVPNNTIDHKILKKKEKQKEGRGDGESKSDKNE